MALEYEIFCRKNGGERLAFAPIVAFGANAAIPHHQTSKTRLKKGDIILLDLGVVVDNYASDMTRCLFFQKPDPLLEKYYTYVCEAQKAALSLCCPKTKIRKLDTAVHDYFIRKEVDKYFIHSTGHGIGLYTHEYPSINQKIDPSVELQENMAITIEPGLYRTNHGGIRYEDTILITQTGYENLYPDPISPYMD